MKHATRSSSKGSKLSDSSAGDEKQHLDDSENKTKVTPKKKASTSAKQKKIPSAPVPNTKKTWIDMSHLSLKRFADDDPTLTAGARRDRTDKHPFVACAEIDPSGRAVCKLCGGRIPKGTLRLALMLQCHKGYRNQCTLHQECFWKHPETKKLTTVDEIVIQKGVDKSLARMVQDRFQSLQAGV